MPSNVTNFTDVIRRTPRKLCRAVWESIPGPIVKTAPMRYTGKLIYRNFTRNVLRVQSHYTHFMRNPPLLDALASLLTDYEKGSTLRLASIGCSTGAELYSTLHVLRRARPDLTFLAQGVDISSAVVEIARRGIYRPDAPAAEDGLYQAGRAEVSSKDIDGFRGILETLPDGTLRVHEWLRENASWWTADATDKSLLDVVGEQDIVLANNFMGPMEDPLAEACLRNIMRLVKPGGLLVVEGIDTDLKTRILMPSEFKPVLSRQEDIWTADPSKRGWPWVRWSYEPLDRNEEGWQFRYSVIFRRVSA
jgi:chemotaxis methyl-accepting protein methylase